MQDIGLIFISVYSAQKLRTSFRPLNSYVVSRCHKVRTESERMIEQKCPTDLTIADQAWIRRLAARISIEKILHDRAAENILCIHDIKRNIEFCSHSPRLSHGIRRAAAVRIFLARFAPQTQHHTDNVIALLLEQGGCNGGVHSSRHGDNNFSHGLGKQVYK